MPSLKNLLPMCILIAAYSSTHAYEAPFVSEAPIIDGSDNDPAWSHAPWEAIDQLTLGIQPSASDFTGRFKVVWTESQLYIMGEITDDILIDSHADPLEQYWDDDTFEIFIDEDRSGGIHLDNYNAFAYHIGLDNQVVDFSTKGKPRLLNDHVTSVWKRSPTHPHNIIWEAAFDIYSDEFSDVDNQAKPVKLYVGKKLGFMVAYCDSDGPDGRQHFIGSHEIEPVDGDKNRGYIDASVFDTLTLVNK